MDICDALKGQYHAAFRMLANCVEKCPDEVWLSGKHPRQFWKIAYHAAFFGHLYLGQNEASFHRWSKNREEAEQLYDESAVHVEPYSKEELLEYIQEIRSTLDTTIANLDLDTADCGFPWYKNITKLEHEILSIRHIQGHVGQLSELLMAHGIDTDWIARRAPAT